MKKYQVIGLMSGTSLDGLDIAACEFTRRGKKWEWKIEAAETVKYTLKIKERLAMAATASAFEMQKLNNWFGSWQGTQVNAFIKKHHLHPDLISSHGHTVFHQPLQGVTLQIGSGAALSAACGIDTVCDFRSTDVALLGQGAPLVPAGDELLFPEYDYCLNIGGFANISGREKGKRLAYDICPVNIVLNLLSLQKGKPYDKNGAFARKGTLSPILLKKLDGLSYYSRTGPKSLGKEWADQQIIPLLNNAQETTETLLHTFVEHAARQTGKALKGTDKKILITGGGALNGYLMERIRNYCSSSLPLPDPDLIAFKEALIFGFLGLLRYRNEINILQSVTGAQRDSSGGCIYKGYPDK